MLTAYDYLTARLLDQVGVDIILVGDSLANVIQGHETTLPVTVDDMIYHAKAVKRAVKNALMVVDMPFMSYQNSVDEAVRNCGRLMKEVGGGAVKLEGGEYIADIVQTSGEDRDSGHGSSRSDAAGDQQVRNVRGSRAQDQARKLLSYSRMRASFQTREYFR